VGVRSGPGSMSGPGSGVRWSRSHIALLVNDLLTLMPAEAVETRALKTRANAYLRDCGCAVGGVFLGGALLLTPPYILATTGLGFRTAMASAIFVLFAALVGKLVGLLFAWVKLGLLYRSLSKNLKRAAPDHVYVH